MPIRVGETIPSVTLKATDMSDVTTDDLFRGKKVVLFSVTGAFTPTCSNQHLPGFVTHADAIRGKGIDDIICVSVNDAHVMEAWGREQHVGDAIRLVADGNGDLARALGHYFDGSMIGFGLRYQRFAAIVENGTVTRIDVEDGPAFDVSSAESVLAALR
ncbi:MAG: peroxiredoxin [Acidobacteria bacterium]|nr:peroxiredoxin [Acidobacteriota bacterium]